MRASQLRPTHTVIFEVTTQQGVTMNKSTNFSGQPTLNQLIMLLDKVKERKIAMQNSHSSISRSFLLKIIWW